MNNGKISVRYARALYNTAKEKGCEKEVYDQLNGFIGQYEANVQQINAVLANPVVGKADRILLLETAIGPDVHPCLKDFLAFVVEKKRENKMFLIALKYGELYREENRILQTRLTTATKLEQTTLDEIRSYIRTKFNANVELQESIDPSIIGGFVFDVGSERYDASIVQQLRQLKKNL